MPEQQQQTTMPFRYYFETRTQRGVCPFLSGEEQQMTENWTLPTICTLTNEKCCFIARILAGEPVEVRGGTNNPQNPFRGCWQVTQRDDG